MAETNEKAAELLSGVMEVTGVSEIEARHLLLLTENDMAKAIQLHYDTLADTGENPNDNAPEGGFAEALAGALAGAFDEEDEEVRAPIPPKWEQLVEPEHDNFLVGGEQNQAGGHREGRLLSQRVKVCPLRDFAREGALMEEEMEAASSDNAMMSMAEFLNRGPRSNGGANAAANKPKTVPFSGRSSQLGDLFRPPIDIAVPGTFQEARNHATKIHHWLIVNVQSDNFDSLLLNRDIWSDKRIRTLIPGKVQLWQVNSDSMEGRRFVTFYHCDRLPYVCIIDPLTGAELWQCADPKDVTSFLSQLRRFLRQNAQVNQEKEDNTPTTSKRAQDTKSSGPKSTVTSDVVKTETDGVRLADAAANVKKRPRLNELSEEEQIALAIRNSMRESSTNLSCSEDEENDNFEDSDDSSSSGSDDETSAKERKPSKAEATVVKKSDHKELLGKLTTELTILKLRSIDAKGAEAMVQLSWPSDTPIEALRAYISEEYPHIPTNGYKLICVFPRKTIESEDDKRSLKEIGLHPSANLHITLDD